MRLSVGSDVGTTCRSVLIGALLGAAALPACADVDLTPDSARILSDPAYLPAARQLVGISAYGFATDNGRVTDALGATRYRFHADRHGPAQVFLYGLSDDLTVQIVASSAWSRTRYDYSAGGSTVHDDSGARVQVGLTYRWLDEQNHPFNLDTGILAPGILTVALSRQMQDFTLSASSGMYHRRSGTEFDEVRGGDLWAAQVWGYFAGLQTQTRLTPDFSVDFGVQFISSNINTVHASSSSVPFMIDYPQQTKLDLALNYHLIRNRWVARVEYDYGFLSSRHDTYSDSTLDLRSPTRDLRAIGIGMIYSF